MTPEKELLHWALQGSMPLVQQSPQTRAAYAADWKLFRRWCRDSGHCAEPANHATVLTYCHALLAKGQKVTTCLRHLSAINSYHRQAGHAPPATRETRQFLSAVKRMRGERESQKRALTIEHLKAMAPNCAETPLGIRNRAILLVGFASALRRSTLVGLDLSDVEFRREGLVLTICREKQDKAGDGRLVAIARGTAETCPVNALLSWIAARGEVPGPLFTPLYHGRVIPRRLHPERIARIVKAAAANLGLDPAEYGGHSLRSGLVTTALEAGVSEIVIAAQTGHRSLSTLRRYFRRRDPFRANASGMVGL